MDGLSFLDTPVLTILLFEVRKIEYRGADNSVYGFELRMVLPSHIRMA